MKNKIDGRQIYYAAGKTKTQIFNRKLIDFRKYLGLTQIGMAQLLEITQGGYSDTERGKINLSEKYIKILVDKGMNPSWYFGLSENMIFNSETLKQDEEPFKIANGIKVYLYARPFPYFSIGKQK